MVITPGTTYRATIYLTIYNRESGIPGRFNKGDRLRVYRIDDARGHILFETLDSKYEGAIIVGLHKSCLEEISPLEQLAEVSQ